MEDYDRFLVLNDNDEAGYFYNDLKQIAMPVDGDGKVAEVLFFPIVLSSCSEIWTA